MNFELKEQFGQIAREVERIAGMLAKQEVYSMATIIDGNLSADHRHLRNIQRAIKRRQRHLAYRHYANNF